MFIGREEKTLTEKITAIWDKRKNKLKHDYSLAVYLLNPHPKVMAEAGSNKSLNHDEAVERLIAMLILHRNLVGDEKKIELACLIDLFWSEYANFTNRLGKFNSDGMWIIAKMDTNLAHEWHKKYSLSIEPRNLEGFHVSFCPRFWAQVQLNNTGSWLSRLRRDSITISKLRS